MPQFLLILAADTEAIRSCMCESFYQILMLPNLKYSHNISVRSTSEGNLYPMGLVSCIFCLGTQTFAHNFIICKNLARSFILGLDF